GSAVSADGHPAHRVRLLGLPRSCRQSCSRRVFFFSCSGAHRDLHSFPTRRSSDLDEVREALGVAQLNLLGVSYGTRVAQQYALRSEEHTSELQSRENLVCRLLLEKKKTKQNHVATSGGKDQRLAPSTPRAHTTWHH